MEHYASAQKKENKREKRAEKAHLIEVYWHRISLSLYCWKVLGLLIPIILLEVVSLGCWWLRDYLFLLLAVGASGWHFALPEAGKRRAEAALATSLLTKNRIPLSLNVVRF